MRPATSTAEVFVVRRKKLLSLGLRKARGDSSGTYFSIEMSEKHLEAVVVNSQ